MFATAIALLPLALAAPTIRRDASTDTSSAFTLISARSGSPVHLLPITASGNGLWLDGTSSTYCPSPPVPDCGSYSNDTIFSCANTDGKPTSCSLNVAVPGGQALFVNQTGEFGYTVPHSAEQPAGSFDTGFTYQKSTESGSFGEFSFTGGSSTGLLACSQNTDCDVETGANCPPWKVVAALPGVCTDYCLGFDALAYATDATAYEHEARDQQWRAAPRGGWCAALRRAEQTSRQASDFSRAQQRGRRPLHLHSSTFSPFFLGRANKHSIDGVLLRSAAAIPGAHEALSLLLRRQIPFVLLTNGGGKSEAERVADLSRALGVKLDVRAFMQSHTPLSEDLAAPAEDGAGPRRDACVLVVGGEGARCRDVAESYGYADVLTTSDLFAAQPALWPFSAPFAAYHEAHARPLRRPLYPGPQATSTPLAEHLRVSAVHVYNDPRDWGLDLTVLMDLLLSHRGFLGTRSGLNGRSDLPNAGYLQDGQPLVTFTNPDLWWAAAYHLNRLGQGGFKAALEGAWAATTRDDAPTSAGLSLDPKILMMGKPHAPTYAFAEKRLRTWRQEVLGVAGGLKRIYMVGDNPASDIAGANGWDGKGSARWRSVLVRSGVYAGGAPAVQPTATVADVREAVRWALTEEGWAGGEEL